MKIKIFRSPDFASFLHQDPLLPLGMASIYRFLKDKGYDITQKDLNTGDYCFFNKQAHVANISPLIDLWLDKKRFFAYLSGAGDETADSILRKYISDEDMQECDVLMISIFSLDLCSSIMAVMIARYFKINFPDKTVVMGGEWMQRAEVYENFSIYYKYGVVDYYIYGYGEAPLDLLLRQLAGEQIGLENIPGLSYGCSGKVFRNDSGYTREPVLPSFCGLPLDRYTWKAAIFFNKLASKKFPQKDILTVPVQNIVGCINRCAFCADSCGSGFAYLKPAQIVENIAKLSEIYNTKYFFFMDSMINFSSNFINDLCNEIIKAKLDIYWSACASFRHVDSPKIPLLMRQAGACRLIFGLETASPSLLNSVNKAIDIKTVPQKLKWLHEAGIWTQLEIIAGLPHETERDVLLTAGFLTKYRKYINGVWLNPFFLSVGSLMINHPDEYGLSNIKENLYPREMLCRGEMRFKYSFDEDNGLFWEEKQKQISNSYEAIKKCLVDNDLVAHPVKDECSVLFYLYEHLKKPREVAYYFRLYGDIFNHRPGMHSFLKKYFGLYRVS